MLKQRLIQTNVLALAAVVFQLPLTHSFISPTIILWFITGLFNVALNSFEVKTFKGYVALLSFYVLLVLGLLWSENMKAAFFDLEVKLTLLIFPLMMSFIQYNKRQIFIIIKVFIIGLSVSFFFLLGKGIVDFCATFSSNEFFYSQLSFIIHPSYLSMYVVVGIGVLYVDLFSRKLSLFEENRTYVIFIILLSCFNILLLSRIGLVFWFLLSIYFFGGWTFREKRFKLGLTVLFSFCVGFYLMYENTSYTKQRVKEIVIGSTSENPVYKNSASNIRFKIWSVAWENIKEKPLFGHGTGDVLKTLEEDYLVNGYKAAAKKHLNAHNQFVQIAVALGLLGVLLFSMVLLFGIYYGIKDKNGFIVVFVLAVLIYSLPESILENQAGTIFFSLFYCLLQRREFSSL